MFMKLGFISRVLNALLVEGRPLSRLLVEGRPLSRLLAEGKAPSALERFLPKRISD